MRIAACVLLGLLAASSGTPAALAADQSSIAVSGAGEVHSRPSELEISGSVSGSAQLASDAVVKFRDSRQRVVDALNGLGIEQLKITGDGPSLTSTTQGNQQAMVNGMPQPAGIGEFVIAEPLTVSISGIDDATPDELFDMLVRVLDACRDAGMTLQPAGATVTFRLSKESLTNATYEAEKKAVEEARQKADRLAGLAGVSRGRVLSIRSVTVTPAPPSRNNNPYNTWTQMMALQMGISPPTGTSGEGTSSNFGDVVTRVNVNVDFAIDSQTADAGNGKPVAARE